MFSILGGDGKEYGPVSVAKIQEWMIAGRANLQTKAKRPNETEWRTLGDFPEFISPTGPRPAAVDVAPPPAPAPAPTYPDAALPATPVAAATPTGTAAEIAAAMIARNHGLDIGRCISRSFELWKNHFLPLVGVTLLNLVIQTILGLIPFVSFANAFFFAGIFTGGLYYYYLGKMRDEPREVSDLFAGFTRALAPLGLTTMIFTALMCAMILPFFGPLLVALFNFAMANQGVAHPELPALSATMLGLALVGTIPLVYFAIAWSFAYALVIDQGLGPWTALEVSRRVISNQWFSMFALMLCAGILGSLGMIFLGIGIIFTIPLTFGSLLYAYEDLCRPPAP